MISFDQNQINTTFAGKETKKKIGYVLAWCARNSGGCLFGVCEVGFVKEHEEEEETKLGGIGVVFDLVDGVVPHSFIGFSKCPQNFLLLCRE